MLRDADRRTRGLVAVGLVVLGFAFLGSRGLLEPDEGRYTNVAAHMLRSGDYLVPALNDETPHFAKPPLTYWAIAASTKLLGHHAWAARLPNGLAWLATVLLVAAIARRLGEREPALAGGVYATLLLPHAGATVVTTDTLLAAFEALGVLGLVGLWRAPGPGARLAAGAGFGLAVLTKGPVGLLPVLAMAVALVAVGQARVLRRWLHPLVWGSFLVVGGSWFGWLAATRPDVLEHLVRVELWGRAVEGEFDRHAYWYGPLLIYLPGLVLGGLPWSPLALSRPRVLVAPLRPAFWRERRRSDPEGLFLLAWMLVPLAVLTLVRSRLPLYLLPVFAPAAVLVARRLDPSRLTREPARALLASWVAVLLGVRVLAAWLPLEAETTVLERELLERLERRPAELVFVDDTPRWSLGYTLDVPVAGATLKDPQDPFPPVSRVIREPAPGRVYLVRRHAEKQFKATVREAGLGYRRLEAWDHQVFAEVLARPSRTR